jgi:hypothetical protein
MVYFGGFFAKLGYFAGFSPHIIIKTIKKYKKLKHKVIKLRALVAKGHKNTNAPLIFENLGYYFFWFWANDFFDPKIAPRCARDNLGVKKVLAPSKYPLKWPIM